MSSNGGMADGVLTARPLRDDFAFNWVFLVELLVCAVLTLFFLFYFNRLFATLISYGLRAWTWHRYRVYIDIQALQVSLLGGRVFFKGFRYHGNNETIIIHSGFITWCYWLRNVRELDIGIPQDDATRFASRFNDEAKDESTPTLDGAEGGGLRKRTELPCRLNVSLHGAEWFVYNRSAAYDAIVAAMMEDPFDDIGDVSEKPHDTGLPDGNLRKRVTKLGSIRTDNSSKSTSLSLHQDDSTSSVVEKGSLSHSGDAKGLHDSSTNSVDGSQREVQAPSASPEGALILRFLPIHIECAKAAVVLGNENTKSVLITKADRVNGEIDASNPATTLDQYRQMFNFHFEHPVVQMKPNDDYKEDQTVAATRIKRGVGDQPATQEFHHHSHSFWHRQRRKAWHKLQDLIPQFRRSVDSLSTSGDDAAGVASQEGFGVNNWQGLSRYLDESEQDDRARWSSVEYATVTTIADSREADMSFYWDVVGNVPEAHSKAVRSGAANVNGDTPPGYGVKLSLRGATINYGPWADRQRADIQKVFFPTLCKNATPSKPLVTGQFRIATEFKVYIELDEETTLRIPIREESKNWKWAKLAGAVGVRKEPKKTGFKGRRKKADKGGPGTETRPFGWLDVKVGPNATVSYVMDMLATTSGFGNKLILDLPTIEVTTSVNHGLLMRSVDNKIACDLSNPLQWNGHHTWKFVVDSCGLELFILREHVFLLTDLVDDWASGPPPDYLTFSPFKYLVNLRLQDFKIYLNVNDANIINNPSDFDDNTYIAIFGSELDADVCIPLDSYRPSRNDISFKVHAHRGGLSLHVPPWNTQATFLSSTEIATLQELLVDGIYQYCATTSPSNTDTLLLNVHGNTLTAQIYGFIIRYYLKVKDNYFGEDIHFRTLEEYQEVLHAKRDGRVDSNNTPPFKKSNDLDVVLAVSANDSSAILPANLYTAKIHTRIEIATLAADLRFTNYYMDLDATFSTLAFSQGTEGDGSATPMSAISNTQLFVDGLNIAGNRLFGLPPTEPTYICNWDFAVGAVTGECTAEFLSRLANGGKAVGFSFDDDENALPAMMEAVLHDVTYLRAYVDSVRVWTHVEEAAFLFSTGSLSVKFNDLAGTHYSKKLELTIPDIQLACVDAESASRHRSRTQHPVETHALLQTAVSFVMIQRKLNFQNDRQLQQEHIKRHDQRTHRTDFLLNHKLLDDTVLVVVDPPAMAVPLMPTPITSAAFDGDEQHSMNSAPSSTYQSKNSVRRKSSFLSIASSSQKSTASVVHPSVSQNISDPPVAEHRSRTPQDVLGPSFRNSNRDVSASTGRRSSFYSAIGDVRGVPTSSITFSSSYIAPYFPLEAIEPDAKDLPRIPAALPSDKSFKENQLGLEDVQQNKFDENTEYLSLMLEFPGGVRAVLNPNSTDAVAALITALQPVRPTDILDDLQIDAMGQVFQANKQKATNGKILDLSVRTQGISVRFLNSSIASASMATSHESPADQYDITISNLSVASRSETIATKETAEVAAQTSLATHLSIGSASFAAKERYNELSDAEAAIGCVVEDIFFWLVSSNETSGNLVVKRLESKTVSSKIEYLASLIHRTEAVASNVLHTFSSLTAQQQSRVQLFTHLVCTTGQRTPDPLFLTRPSYVLRSAASHLRTSDSWKVITRLHHMYSNLDTATKQDITIRCINNAEVPPEDTKSRVLSAFAQWRNWDLNDVHECHVMARVFGNTTPSLALPASHKIQHFKFAFNTQSVCFVLDPGPKQNEIMLSAISATAERRAADLSSPTKRSQSKQSNVLQMFCSEVSVNLNWELCELADSILKLYHQKVADVKPQNPRYTTQTKSAPSELNHDYHIVLATGKGVINIDTINIRAVSISQGLKGSFVLSQDTNASLKQVSCLLLTADAATSKIKSHSQELTLYQLRFPSVYVSREFLIADNVPTNAFKVAANCQELSFVVRQDISALIEVADLVIGDEVARLHRLLQRLPTNDRPQLRGTESTVEQSSVTKVNVALFLDMYHISVPLLSSLTYNISGVIARASVAAQLGADVVFDFDVKEHSHDIQTLGRGNNRSISLLQMPPTNGRVITNLHKDETTVSVFASVEPIELDAAAVHSLLAALNRPEISSVIADMQEDLNTIQLHIKDIFGKPEEPPLQTPTNPAKALIYDAHVTLAGFEIFANAQGMQKGGHTARLNFNLGCMQLVVTNRLDQSRPVLDFPELRLAVHQITFEISRRLDGIMEPCGNLSFAAFLTATSKINDTGTEVRSFHLKSDSLEINLFADTASSVIDILGHLQEKIKDLDLSRERRYLRTLRKPKPRLIVSKNDEDADESMSTSTVIFASMYSLELLSIQVSWLVGTSESGQTSAVEPENLVLSLKRIDLSTKKENSARLTIEDLQLQMVPASQDKTQRSLNSALLPEVIFNVGYMSTVEARRLAFQAAGKSLDLRLTSQFMIPAAELQKSIVSAIDKVRAASETWMHPSPSPVTEPRVRKPFFGKKRMESLLVDADFAGAVVYLTAKNLTDGSSFGSGINGGRVPQAGRYGQFTHTDASSNTVLRAPGLAWKVEYKDSGVDEPSLNAEVKVDASSNILYPAVVPLMMEITSTVKEIVSDEEDTKSPKDTKTSPVKFLNVEEDNILTADPSAVLGRTRLNLGLRICRQEFSLSCQPIARVAATARFEDIYLTINTVRSTEHGHFFTATAAFSKLQASVQHVYSRESTGSFDVDTVFLSLMNSKHVSGTSGLSAILKISPMKVLVNAKQLQDFLLFREIWVPPEVRQTAPPSTAPAMTPHSQTILVQRYQQVAATGAFPWNATVSIAELDVRLDLGQAIGKSSFMISKFWVSSKKNSDWEQNLCLGFDKIGVDSTGRMSGYVALQDFKLRTSIQWPAREMALNQTPLVQGSLAFSQLRIKAAFDYQAFLVADITSFEFLMYNVRNTTQGEGDRLVAILDGEAVQVFCTTTTASQALALFQAFQRLVQEKRSNYEASLTEIEKFMKRKSVSHPQPSPGRKPTIDPLEHDKFAKSPISLHTDVIVTLKAVNVGAFPNTFSDHQVFKLEAMNAQARFAVTMDTGKIHSVLGLTLGQLRIGLAGVKKIEAPKSVGDISVEDVVSSATGSRGGTILKVPKVEAIMQTWQIPNSNHIDYIFKSSFEGKVEVGWNYSRISYIRSMWASHSKALAQRLGKPLPPSAVKITGVPDEERERKDGEEQQKITAEVNVPQSRYDYTALEPPIIETPQLRDMGEATPPLEWIGLHRDRLPNLTHQIVIVTLLELASEVEEAYGKILGST